jgi:site-specific DNA-methyltransferase (adenine-specific)
MLDLLPPDVWTNPELRFLDPGCKSGVFLREAAKRLMKGLEVAIPDEAARREHIFKNMLHGIAITELTAQISRRTLYYSKDASSEQSVVQLPTADGNIRYQNIAHTFKAGSCIHCGAPEAAARDLESLESHAYLFIHEELDPAMKFDVIIGNPPYQLGTQKVQENGKRKANAKPIYNYFVAQALQMRPRYVSMIIPSRWFNSDLSELRAFRALMQKQPPVRLIDLPDENDAFPGIECKGGVCYFLTDLAESGEVKTQFEKFEKTEVVSSVSRVLSEFDDIFREPEQYSIVKKVIDGMEPSLSDMFSAQTPFDLDT